MTVGRDIPRMRERKFSRCMFADRERGSNRIDKIAVWDLLHAK